MSTDGGGIRIVAIPGSVRPDNFTSRVLRIALEEFENHAGVVVDYMDPGEMRLAVPGRSSETDDAERLQEAVGSATGVILATPEYHGSLSSVMKLVIENLGFPSRLAGKPVALLGAASGRIGAIKSLEQLRSICSHVSAIVLPGPVSVANVRTVFDEDGRITDQTVEAALHEAHRLCVLIHPIQIRPQPRRRLWHRDLDGHVPSRITAEHLVGQKRHRSEERYGGKNPANRRFHHSNLVHLPSRGHDPAV